ncbi:unnamed protein product [Amoebophrya sp. A120]|nr:unnamed protein product [Amoebophrya sp. A120]|eukprot:GSA120T00014581001.1
MDFPIVVDLQLHSDLPNGPYGEGKGSGLSLTIHVLNGTTYGQVARIIKTQWEAERAKMTGGLGVMSALPGGSTNTKNGSYKENWVVQKIKYQKNFIHFASSGENKLVEQGMHDVILVLDQDLDEDENGNKQGRRRRRRGRLLLRCCPLG